MKIFSVAAIFCMLVSFIIHVVDGRNKNTDSVDMEPVVPNPSLPLDVIDQVLQKSVYHSPQDLVNARLVGTRYQRAFPSEQRRHQFIQLRKRFFHHACGTRTQLHLEASLDPLEDLTTLMELCDHASYTDRNEHRRGYHQATSHVFHQSRVEQTEERERPNFRVRYTHYLVRMGLIPHEPSRTLWFVADFTHVYPNFYQATWVLPCPLTTDQVMNGSYRYIYRIFGEPHDEESLVASSAVPESSRKGVRIWTVVFQQMGRGRIRGVCAGMGYLQPPPIPSDTSLQVDLGFLNVPSHPLSDIDM